MGLKYRYKNGDFISSWLPVESIREAVAAKKLTSESKVQQAGRDDWVLASSIPGLIVTAPPPIEEASPAKESDPIPRLEPRKEARPAETIHHLLHRVLNSTVYLTAPHGDNGEEVSITGTVIGVTADGFMLELSEIATILYVPLARVCGATIATSFPNIGPARRNEIARFHVESIPESIASNTAIAVHSEHHSTSGS